MKGNTIRAVAAAVAGTLLIGVLVLAILVYAGAYNVAAAAGHSSVGRWLLETVMRQSVEARADAVPPKAFTKEMIAAGAGEYKSMCQQCHGGPSVTRDEWAQGIVPKPPELGHEAREWSAGEIHWIVKNGIKMTAMPSFGATHDDQTIWNITAFVKQLPGMTPETYAAFPEGHGGAGHHSDSEQQSSDSQQQAGGHAHSTAHE